MKLIWEPMVVAAMLIESMPETQGSRDGDDDRSADNVKEDSEVSAS